MILKPLNIDIMKHLTLYEIVLRLVALRNERSFLWITCPFYCEIMSLDSFSRLSLLDKRIFNIEKILKNNLGRFTPWCG